MTEWLDRERKGLNPSPKAKPKATRELRGAVLTKPAFGYSRFTDALYDELCGFQFPDLERYADHVCGFCRRCGSHGSTLDPGGKHDVNVAQRKCRGDVDHHPVSVMDARYFQPCVTSAGEFYLLDHTTFAVKFVQPSELPWAHTVLKDQWGRWWNCDPGEGEGADGLDGIPLMRKEAEIWEAIAERKRAVFSELGLM